MYPTDMKELAAELDMRAEVHGTKPPTDKAVAEWFDSLRAFPIESVRAALKRWSQRNVKFPVISEIWRDCNDSATREREREAASLKATDTAFERSARGRECLNRIRAELTGARRGSAREHWEKVLSTAPAGTIGHRYALEALRKLPDVREPGAD